MRQPQCSVLPETARDDHDQPRQRARPPVVERIAGWSARHRKTAVLGWLVLVAALFAAGHALGTKSVPDYDPGQSGQAERTLHSLTGNSASPPAESVLIRAKTPGTTFASDPQMRQAARQVAAALRALPRSAADIRSPLGPGGTALASAGGRSALVTFTVPGNPNDATLAVQPAQHAVAAVQAGHPGLVVAETGDASISAAVSSAIGSDFRKAEATSVPVTLIPLVVVFGALVAAGIPVLLAVTAVIAAVSLLSVVGRWLPVGASTSEVVLIIGMAVGVDYSLFYLRREREERARGRSAAQALAAAAPPRARPSWCPA
jgi:putative drug exporter of the RND superfamily